MGRKVKLNGWLKVVVLLMGMMGLLTWVITADNRLHARCDSLETKHDEHVEKEAATGVQIAEIKGDIKVILKTMELLYPEKTTRAKELNGDTL